MPYCQRCGKEHGEDDVYCPSCGSPVKAGVERRYVRRGWDAGRLLSMGAGAIILLVAFGLIVGGGALVWVRGEFSDEEGFLVSREVRIMVGSHAVVQEDVDIQFGPIYFPLLRIREPSDIATLKIVARGVDPMDEIFIGVARSTYASDFLSGVSYDELVEYEWDYDPFLDDAPQVTLRTHSGSAPGSPPTSETFWEASATGSGTQTLTWVPETGSFWIVGMNADGSAGMDVVVSLGINVPVLRFLGSGLLVGGLVLLALGWIFFSSGLQGRR